MRANDVTRVYICGTMERGGLGRSGRVGTPANSCRFLNASDQSPCAPPRQNFIEMRNQYAMQTL